MVKPIDKPGRKIEISTTKRADGHVYATFYNPVDTNDVHTRLVWLCSAFEYQTHNMEVTISGWWYSDDHETDINIPTYVTCHVSRVSRYGILVRFNYDPESEIELKPIDGLDCEIVFDLSVGQEGYMDGPKYSSSTQPA